MIKMGAITQEVFTKRPTYGDTCDMNCPAKALVRVSIKVGEKICSLVLCGHCYDTRPPSLQKVIVGTCDTRLIK